MRIVFLRAGFVLLVIVLAAWTHFPVLRAGATGGDLGVIASLAPEAVAPADWAALPAPPPRLVGESLRVLSAAPDLFGLEHGAGNVHVAQFVLLLLATLGASLAARQALEPWIGAEGAAGAGRATALLVPLHPLAGAAIGSFEAHGVLFASAAGALAAALFFRARRTESTLQLVAAFLLLALASAAGRAVFLFAVAIAVSEWTSTRRHRPAAARVKSTLATLLTCTAVVAGTWIAVGERDAWDLGRGTLDQLALDAVAHGFEKLGVLLFPGTPSGGSAARLVVLGVLLVVVLHPALLAARSAPRLWGRIACVTGLLIAAGLTLHPRVRVAPGALASAHIVLPAVLVLAAGIATCATALVGNRRVVLPLLCAVAWSLHGRAVLEPWPKSAADRAELAAELRSAVREHGPCAELWVVDPPYADDPLAGFPRAFAWVLHPGITAAASVEPSASRTRVRSALPETLLLAMRDPSFASLRTNGLVLWLPPTFAGDPGEARFALRVALAGEAPRERVWRGEGRSPALEADPAGIAGVRVLALAQTSTAEAPRLAWRARDERFDGGQIAGVWLSVEGESHAWFDLSSDPRFLLGRRIARVSFEGELARMRSAELLASVPAIEVGEPEVSGADWRFAPPKGALPVLARGEGAWSLALFDPDGLASMRLAVERAPDGALLARGAVRFEHAARARGGKGIAWWLEYRAGDVTLCRSGGRL